MKLRYLYWKMKDKIFCLRFKKLKKCNLPYHYFDEKSQSEKWVYYRDNNFTYCQNLEYALGDIGKYNLTYHLQTKVHYYPKNIEKIDIIHFHDFDSVIQALYKNPESFSIPKEYLHEYSEQQLKYLKTLKSFFKIIELKDTESSKEVKKIEQEYDNLYSKNGFVNKIKLEILGCKMKKLTRQDKRNRCINSRAKEFESYSTIGDKELIEKLLKTKNTYLIYKYPNKNKNHRYLLLKENEYVGIAESYGENQTKLKDLKEETIDFDKNKSFKEYKKALLKDYQEYDKNFTEDSYIYVYKIKLLEKF